MKMTNPYVRQKIWRDIERTSQQLGIFLMMGSYRSDNDIIGERVGYDKYKDFESILKVIKKKVRENFDFQEFLNFIELNKDGEPNDDELFDEWRNTLDTLINYYNCDIFFISRVRPDDEHIYEKGLIIPAVYRVANLITEVPSLKDWSQESIDIHNINIDKIPESLIQ